jgi:pectate lyase
LIAAGAAVLAVAAATVTTQMASAEVTLAGETETVAATIQVDGVFDGAGKRFVADGALGDGGQDEGQDAMFELADGATLTNVVLGSPAADGVHCSGSCTLKDVTWEDVGEDAATFRGENATVLIEGGSAASGTDKVFQDNRGAGGSVTIRDFAVSDFGKLYRSCGNCSEQAARTVTISDVTATAPGKVIAGVNANLGDKVTLSGITITGDGAEDVHVCELFEGNDTGDEPTKIADEPDGVTCKASGVTVG